MWKRGCSEATGSGTAAGSGGCDAGFGEMGQTWSQPQLGYLKNWSSTLALMFAAGYDKPAEDPQSCFVTAWDATTVTAKTGVVPTIPMNTTNCPPSGGTSTVFNRTMGRGVYILNALTGDILWRVGPEATATRRVTGMTYAMPADLAVLKNRSNTAPRATDIGNENVPFGYLDRIYASDTGGTVWRIDVADASGTTTTPPNFVVTQLASIAVAPATGTHAALNYRKFLFSPDVVYSSDTTDYDAVLLGSGDREHAFDMVVQNRFYMFKDRNTGSLTSTAVPVASQPTPPTGVIADTSTSTDLFDVTNNCLQAAANCGSGQTQTIAQAALLAAKGWKLSLSITGEKTIATATTSAGSVIFNTNEPKQDTVTGTVGQCTSDLGTARQYAINFQNATATNIFSLPAQYVATGGRYAMFAGGGFLPTPVPVVVQIGGKYYQTVVAGVQTTNPGGLRLQSRVRTFWYKKVD
jgi:type IV pilus assembly protein PilY1